MNEREAELKIWTKGIDESHNLSKTILCVLDVHFRFFSHMCSCNLNFNTWHFPIINCFKEKKLFFSKQFLKTEAWKAWNDNFIATSRVNSCQMSSTFVKNSCLCRFQSRSWSVWPPGRRVAAATWSAVCITDTRPVTKIDTDASSTRRPGRQCRAICTELPWA